MQHLKAGVASLGCDKNRVDTEEMLGALSQLGFEITRNPEEADLLLVNTCGFIRPAVEESIQTILELARWKKQGKCKVLLVAGCLLQRYKAELMKEIPEIDDVIYSADSHSLAQVISKFNNRLGTGIRFSPNSGPSRILSTPSHVAYLKIAEGCNNRCTYCLIPTLRGPYKSKPIEIILAEAEMLVRQGVRELVLVAQDVTSYGIDLYNRFELVNLVKALAAIEDLRWVRLQYLYPDRISDELLAAFKSIPKLCRYFDIPFQHGSTKILARMGRRGSRESYLKLVEELKREFPGAGFRTSLIVGFPGEDKDDFKELLQFVEEIQFAYAGAFVYWREEGTPASKLAGQLPLKVKMVRKARLMRKQRRILEICHSRLIGKTVRVIVDESPKTEGVAVGRTEGQSLGIDGFVRFSHNGPLDPGEIVNVKITDSKGHILIGAQT